MKSDILDPAALLQAWSSGDRSALAELTPLLYQELRALARRHLAGERPGHTLNTTALVHEAWLRLAGARGLNCATGRSSLRCVRN